MKTVSLQNLKDFPVNVKYFRAVHIKPNLDVNDYHYTDTPYGHFLYAIKGYANYIYKGQCHEIYPNSLTYIPTGADPYLNTDSEFEYTKIFFTIIENPCMEEVILSDSILPIFNDTPGNIQNIISEIVLCYSSTPKYFIKQYSLFYTLLDNIISTYLGSNINSGSSHSISPAIQFIKNNFRYEFTTKELADMCNLSEPYFRKLFKETMHSTPTDYKNYIRINRACHYLIIGPTTISKISSQVGYKNLQYFYKVFKSFIGISPTEYRKRASTYKRHTPQKRPRDV